METDDKAQLTMLYKNMYLFMISKDTRQLAELLSDQFILQLQNIRWGEMPVYTFLEGHNFSGKTIIPFCTHTGSGLSGTEKSIESLCPDSEILVGLSIKGEDAQNSQDQARETVNEWLENLSY